MIGGLFTSFLMELLAYPAIYYRWKRAAEVQHREGGFDEKISTVDGNRGRVLETVSAREDDKREDVSDDGDDRLERPGKEHRESRQQRSARRDVAMKTDYELRGAKVSTPPPNGITVEVTMHASLVPDASSDCQWHTVDFLRRSPDGLPRRRACGTDAGMSSQVGDLIACG